MRYLICFLVLFIVTSTKASEESNQSNSTIANSTITEDSIDSEVLDSTSTSTSTIAPIVVSIITEDSSSGSGDTLISPELTNSTEPGPKPVSNINVPVNNSLSKPSNESETSKESKGNNTTLSAEATEPIILIPLKQNSAQSVIIPTLRAYQKYFTPSSPPANIGKRKINAFTDTATPCPTCGRMVCGNNGNLCPVCLHSGRSNLAAIEKSINLESVRTEEDPLALYGSALRNRRKNAWRVATIMRPGSLAANQNKLPSELRTGRNLWSWFGLSGQKLQPNEEIIVKPSSESSLPTFLREASSRPQLARICYYPEWPVMIAPQSEMSQRVSSFQTILSAVS